MDDLGQSRGKNPRFAGPGAGQHQHRPVQRFDRFALRVVQRFQPRRLACRGGGRLVIQRVAGEGIGHFAVSSFGTVQAVNIGQIDRA